jgi:STE24 endopeptidase
MKMKSIFWFVAVFCIGMIGFSLQAQEAAPSSVEVAKSADTSLAAARITPADAQWTASLPLDAEQATEAYMQRIPVEAKHRATAYFEGGYWLQLWNLVWGWAVALILLA